MNDDGATKTAVITGGAGDLAREVAARLRAEGWQVHAPGRSELDVTSSEQVRAYFARLQRVDLLVNQAGVIADAPLAKMTPAAFDQALDVNLTGAFRCAREWLWLMARQRRGHLIQVGSLAALRGTAGQANYAASKAGIVGFTKSVAKELGSRNIRANAIAPGFIETEMTDKLDAKVVQGWRDGIPLKRGGAAVDVANACLFLASDLSAYITGQVLNVDGGMLT